MNADDRYLINCINETADEKQRASMIPDSGSFDANREDGKASTPEERTRYQKQRGKEFKELISKQRTAPYVSELSKDQRRKKIVSARYAAKTYADAKTYGYRYALKNEDKRNEASNYQTDVYGDFKQFKKANPSKNAKDYFDAYYSIKTTAISAGDKEDATKGLALYKAGADDATFRHFGIDKEKRKVFKRYLNKYGGSENEYYAATNAIQRNKAGDKATIFEKVMTLAEREEPDRVYYAVGVLSDDQMNLGRGLVAEGFTISDINTIKTNAQAYNEDGKGGLKKEEAKEYVESLGLKSQRQKALVFATLSSAKNPFGSFGTYSLEGDVLGDMSSGSSSGGGGGGGSRKSSGSVPSWEKWVKDYLNNDTTTNKSVKLDRWDSPLDSAYRKKITSLNMK